MLITNLLLILWSKNLWINVCNTQHTAHTHNFHYSTESSKTKFRTNIGCKPHYETWYSRVCDDNFRRLSWTDDGLTCLSNNCQSCSVSVAFPMAQLLQYYKYVAYQVIFSIVHFCRFSALPSRGILIVWILNMIGGRFSSSRANRYLICNPLSKTYRSMTSSLNCRGLFDTLGAPLAFNGITQLLVIFIILPY